MLGSADAPGVLVMGADEVGIAGRHKARPFARSTSEGGHAAAVLPHAAQPAARSATGFVDFQPGRDGGTRLRLEG